MPLKSFARILKDKAGFILLIAGMLVVAVARMHLLDFPMERDEGEYATMGWLMLHGYPPFALAGNMKLPGTAMLYALFLEVGGETTEAFRMGYLILSLLTMLWVYQIGQKFYSGLLPAIAAVSAGVLAMQQGVLGQAAHATQFVNFFVLLALFLLLLAQSKPRSHWWAFGAGVALALAFWCKQQALVFLPFLAMGLLIPSTDREPAAPKKWPHLMSLSAGFSIPVIMLLFYIGLYSNWDNFSFWMFRYLPTYHDTAPASEILSRFGFSLRFVTRGWSVYGSSLLWASGLIGIFCLFFSKKSKGTVWVGLYLLAAGISVLPGWWFRPHYYVTLIPALALATPYLYIAIKRFLFQYLPKKFASLPVLMIFLTISSLSLWNNRYYLFFADNALSCKTIYRDNPFPESAAIAGFIQENTLPGSKIAVFGSEPQIYFLSKRLPACGFLYTYPLTEKQPHALSMQQQYIASVEKSMPAMLVHVDVSNSWSEKPSPHSELMKWFASFISAHYELVAYVCPDERSEAKLITAPLEGFAKSENVIWLYKRKSADR